MHLWVISVLQRSGSLGLRRSSCSGQLRVWVVAVGLVLLGLVVNPVIDAIGVELAVPWALLTTAIIAYLVVSPGLFTPRMGLKS